MDERDLGVPVRHAGQEPGAEERREQAGPERRQKQKRQETSHGRLQGCREERERHQEHQPGRRPGPTRRALLGIAAASAVATATAVRADTQPLLEEPTSGFVTDEAKRAAFEKKQRAYKKAWRRYLSDLEFATGDEEAVGAIKSLAALIRARDPHPRRHPRSLRSRPHPWPYAPGRSLHV